MVKEISRYFFQDAVWIFKYESVFKPDNPDFRTGQEFGSCIVISTGGWAVVY